MTRKKLYFDSQGRVYHGMNCLGYIAADLRWPTEYLGPEPNWFRMELTILIGDYATAVARERSNG